ncbi:MAG: hypothetical protein C0506_07780 [Anaerolinea sp.]|nr:hypothetical protein [Anaerolinea sp.]
MWSPHRESGGRAIVQVREQSPPAPRKWRPRAETFRTIAARRSPPEVSGPRGPSPDGAGRCSTGSRKRPRWASAKWRPIDYLHTPRGVPQGAPLWFGRRRGRRAKTRRRGATALRGILPSVDTPGVRSGYRAGARDSLPLCVAVAAFGVSFGVLAEASGFGRFAPIVMSLTTFTGASQFAAVSILGAGGGVGAAVVAAILLAARYGPIGISVAPSLRGNALTRFLHAQLVIDESWAVASQPGGGVARERLIGAGLALYVAWQLGTIAGVVGGDLVGDPESIGLDAAFPALFLALLVPQLGNRRAFIAAAAGAAIALALIPFARPGVPVIAATLGCLAGWGWRDSGHPIESVP